MGRCNAELGALMHNTERKVSSSVSWLKNSKDSRKPYEDRYRLLTRDIPLVGKSGRGELLAVMDGIGGASMGMAAAQAVLMLWSGSIKRLPSLVLMFRA